MILTIIKLKDLKEVKDSILFVKLKILNKKKVLLNAIFSHNKTKEILMSLFS